MTSAENPSPAIPASGSDGVSPPSPSSVEAESAGAFAPMDAAARTAAGEASASKRSTRSRWDALAALVLFALTFACLLAGERSVGFVRDEGIYFESGRRYAAWYLDDIPKLGLNAFKDGAIKARFETNREHPALMKSLFGVSERVFAEKLHLVRPATGFRLPSIFISGLFAALIFLFGRHVTSRRGAFFAALAFWTVPRTFFHGVLSCFDVPIAFAWLLTVAAYRQAILKRTWKWAVLTGLAFGFALSVKHNAWIIPCVLLVHWALATAPEAFGRGRWKAVVRSLAPLFSMAAIGPLVLYATWPFLWHHPVDRFLWYADFHNDHINYPWEYFGTVLFDAPFPLGYALGLTVVTVPLALLVLMATGSLHEMVRFAFTYVFRPIRRRFGSSKALKGEGEIAATPMENAPRHADGDACQESGAAAADAAGGGVLAPLDSDTLLLLGNGFALLFVFSMPFIPIFGGVKHWIGAMPFLCLFAARALERVASTMSLPLEKRLADHGLAKAKGRVGCAAFALLALLTLLPGVMGLVRVHPYGTSFYNELAGGLPGGASLGMHRQYWSNNVTGVLPWINAHAPRRAKVYLHEVTGFAFRDYKDNGMLRKDLRPAGSPSGADIVAYQFMPEFRDAEFVVWNEFGTLNPAYGLYVDETPQVMVYVRGE